MLMHPDADKLSVAAGLKIKYRGVFDLDDFYKKLKLWLDAEGYGDENKSFRESKYVERIGPYGKNIEIKWVAERQKSDYFSYYITILFYVRGTREAEMVYDNKKVKATQGEVELRISADLIKNVRGKWKSNSFIKKIYETLIVEKRIEEYKIEVYKLVYSFHDEIKMYLNLSRRQ